MQFKIVFPSIEKSYGLLIIALYQWLNGLLNEIGILDLHNMFIVL